MCLQGNAQFHGRKKGIIGAEVMDMSAIQKKVPPLVAGDYLSREEFLRRWEAMPHIKRAELIQGIVYMPSPLSLEHGDADNHVGTWIGGYEAANPGFRDSKNGTWQEEARDTARPGE